jgi:hypothetical protein
MLKYTSCTRLRSFAPRHTQLRRGRANALSKNTPTQNGFEMGYEAYLLLNRNFPSAVIVAAFNKLHGHGKQALARDAAKRVNLGVV